MDGETNAQRNESKKEDGEFFHRDLIFLRVLK